MAPLGVFVIIVLLFALAVIRTKRAMNNFPLTEGRIKTQVKYRKM